MNAHLGKRLISISSLVLFLLFLGCSTTYQMEVDAIKNPKAEDGDSYILLPRDPDQDTQETQYKETEAWIKTALSAKGMYEANTPESADMVILVDYGMEPPRQEYKVIEEPVFVNIREPDRVETVVQTDPKTGATRSYQIVRPGRIRRELVGYQERIIPYIVNEKYLELSAKENETPESGDKPAQELWSINVRNLDDNDDLREYLPIMVASATDYVGEDTENNTTVRLKNDDEVVEFIKKGIQEQAVNQYRSEI